MREPIIPRSQEIYLASGLTAEFFDFAEGVQKCPDGYRPVLASIMVLTGDVLSALAWGIYDDSYELTPGNDRRLQLDSQTDVDRYYFDDGDYGFELPRKLNSTGLGLWWIPYVKVTTASTSGYAWANLRYEPIAGCGGER